MRTHRRPPLLALALAVAPAALAVFAAGAPHARAQDAPSDPAELLRTARTAESVEKDDAKAVLLYRRVLDVAPQTDAARDAALRLLAIHEARGEHAAALEAVRALADRTARLDDAGRRAVHDAAVRLLRASGGGEVRTPIGTLVVLLVPASGAARGGSAGAPATPLDEKILPLVARIESLPQNERGAAQAEAHRVLATIGPDALPVLARDLRVATPSRATLVATLASNAFRSAAVPMFEAVVLDGDPVARGVAWAALTALPPSDAKRAALRRLLDAPAAASVSPPVVDVAGRELEEAELLALASTERAVAPALLFALLARGSPEAFDRLLATASGAPDAAWSVLARLAARSALTTDRLRRDQLDALATLAAARKDGPDAARVPALLTALSMARWRTALPTDPAERERAAEGAWRRFVELPRDERAPYVAALAGAGIEVPPALFSDAAWASALLTAVPQLAGDGADVPLAEAVRQGDRAFWDAVLDACERAATVDVVGLLLGWAVPRETETPRLPDGAVDPRWAEVAARTGLFEALVEPHVAFVLDAAARSGSPAFLALVRRWLAGDPRLAGGATSDPSRSDDRAARASSFAAAVAAWSGPDRLELWAEVIERLDRRWKTGSLARALDAALRGAPAEDALAAARRWRAARGTAAAYVIDALVARRDRASVLRLAGEETTLEPPSSTRFRQRLLEACDELTLRDAWPYLLRELEGGLASEARSAMESIHQREQERLRFESLGRPPAAREEDLTSLLGDADPAIRRGAVLSMAATAGKAALPALLRFAKAEKDAAVRALALETVERLAKSDLPPQPPAAPTPEQPR